MSLRIEISYIIHILCILMSMDANFPEVSPEVIYNIRFGSVTFCFMIIVRKIKGRFPIIPVKI